MVEKKSWELYFRVTSRATESCCTRNQRMANICLVKKDTEKLMFFIFLLRLGWSANIKVRLWMIRTWYLVPFGSWFHCKSIAWLLMRKYLTRAFQSHAKVSGSLWGLAGNVPILCVTMLLERTVNRVDTQITMWIIITSLLNNNYITLLFNFRLSRRLLEMEYGENCPEGHM